MESVRKKRPAASHGRWREESAASTFRAVYQPALALRLRWQAASSTLVAGPIAQWLEPPAHNRLVPGSSPGGPSLRSRLQAEAARRSASREGGLFACVGELRLASHCSVARRVPPKRASAKDCEVRNCSDQRSLSLQQFLQAPSALLTFFPANGEFTAAITLAPSGAWKSAPSTLFAASPVPIATTQASRRTFGLGSRSTMLGGVRRPPATDRGLSTYSSGLARRPGPWHSSDTLNRDLAARSLSGISVELPGNKLRRTVQYSQPVQSGRFLLYLWIMLAAACGSPNWRTFEDGKGFSIRYTRLARPDGAQRYQHSASRRIGCDYTLGASEYTDR